MRHWIPPLGTYKMALSTARLHRVRGRPPLVAAGITSVIHSHSSAVRSLGYGFSFLDPLTVRPFLRRFRRNSTKPCIEIQREAQYLQNTLLGAVYVSRETLRGYTKPRETI